ncbi:T9SS type A sorting domain-containing protein [Flavipsychrobacter stenotrophus]|nr:T9SS type A sorting domain-containing protein [Flavipsychrobacter stenotrophus]
MKHLITCALVFLCLSSSSYGQCSISAHRISETHVHDTTYQVMVADTAGLGSGYTYTWLSDIGTSHTGSIVSLPVIDASTIHSYTITASAPGTTCSSTDNISTNLVFNCTMLPGIDYGYSGAYTFRQSVITDPNSIYIQFPHGVVNDLDLKVNMHINWGNGTATSLTQALDTLALIGGIADPAHSSHYQYAGQYIISTQYSYSYDTLTCPITIMPKTALWVAGNAGRGAPQIGGSRAYCVGDTLRLGIVDTIAQFLNAYHRTDTTGVLHYDIVPMAGGTYPVFGPNRLYSWSHDGSYFGLSLDTTLVIPNLTLADTGTYYMQMWENISMTDTILQVHVTINNTSPVVSAITGASSVCEGSFISLSNITPGGVWSSSSPDASVSGGIVSGISAGSANISYTVTNGCGATTVTYPLSILPSSVCTAGITGHKKETGISIYPNPSYGSFEVSVPGQNAIITITDVTGKVVYTAQSTDNSNIPVAGSSLAKGTYLILVDCEGSVYRDKVTIW